MSISQPFIARPVATTLLTIGILLLGIVSYGQLGVSAVPNVDFPVIFLTTSLPGASPETMATSVSTPLERQLGTLSGVSELTSVNGVGSSTIIVQFNLERDIEDAARDVQAAINAASANLPKDLPHPPTYFKANPNQQPILTLALSSDTLPASDVFDYANNIVSQKLSQIEGVAQVSISGAEATAVRVQVDPGRLASLGVSLEDVRAAIQAATNDRPKGSLDGAAQSWSIDANDQLTSADQYRPVIIAWRNGAPVRLGDVAKVFDSVNNDRVAAWLNTSRAVVVRILKQPQANMIATIDRVRTALPLLQNWMPPSIKVAVTADRTVIVRQGIIDVQRTLLLTTALVVSVIAVFLRRFWATVIPSITIPVSIAAAFPIMYMAGFTLDNLSLMALLVSVGFVVDDAIVMIENIVRLIENGVSPLQAALRGSRQMGFTVISITASLLSALVPLMFMGGVLGRFFREFSVTLAAAITVSAVVSLTLTPMLCGRLLSRGNVKASSGRVSMAIEGWLERLSEAYGASLERVLKHPRLVMAATVLLVVATFALFVILPKSMMPTQDLGVIRASTDAPPDISFAAMRDRQLKVADVILKDPAVHDLTSSIGASGGGGGPFGGGGLNSGSLTINLVPPRERKETTVQVIDRLRPALAKVEGIDTFMTPVQDFGGGARAGKARYQYTLTGGVDLATLEKWVDLVQAKFATLPELADVATDQDSNGRQVSLVIDRRSAARLGVTPAVIDQTLYDAFGQRQVATWYGDRNQYKVILEVDPAFRQSPETMGSLYLPGAGQVPLSAVTRREEGFAPVSLNHQGQVLAITITYNTAPGVSIGRALTAIDKAVDEIHLPAEISSGSAGEAFDTERSNQSMPLLLAAAVIGMYLVLGILYESFVHPLTILSTIPSAAFGALLALLVTGMDLSMVAMVGVILLIGIVKKNAILMVDFALVAERELGLTPHQAIVRAARLRLRPITMTTLAAVLGAIPLAIGMGVGSELRQPLGVAMIGGLTISQFVTLYTTPVMFLAVDWLRGKRRSRWLPAKASAS